MPQKLEFLVSMQHEFGTKASGYGDVKLFSLNVSRQIFVRGLESYINSHVMGQ